MAAGGAKVTMSRCHDITMLGNEERGLRNSKSTSLLTALVRQPMLSSAARSLPMVLIAKTKHLYVWTPPLTSCLLGANPLDGWSYTTRRTWCCVHTYIHHTYIHIPSTPRDAATDTFCGYQGCKALGNTSFLERCFGWKHSATHRMQPSKPILTMWSIMQGSPIYVKHIHTPASLQYLATSVLSPPASSHANQWLVVLLGGGGRRESE